MSVLTANVCVVLLVWDQDTTLGPMIVLPSKQKSTPLSPRTSGGIDIPGFPASTGDRKPVSPGSRWRGMDFKRGNLTLTWHNLIPYVVDYL